MSTATAEEICYEKNMRTQSECSRRECRYWISHSGASNCTIVAASKGPMTLQQIGEIIGVTRMRVCQLEKKILHDLHSGYCPPSHQERRGAGSVRPHTPSNEYKMSEKG